MISRRGSLLTWLTTIAACGQANRPGQDKLPVIGEPYQSECLNGNWGYGENSDSIEVLVSGDSVTITDHFAEFNCCLDAWMEVSIAGNEITVVEQEDPDGCDPLPECSAPVDCLNLPWEIYCLGRWDCVDNQCQPVCDSEACGDGTCDYAGGEGPKSCPDDCGC